MSVSDTDDPTGQSRDESFTVKISDETFVFAPFALRDQKATGAQIAEAFGKHPVENFVVLQHLVSGELESLRPTELTDLSNPGREHFFVIEGEDTHRFRAAGLSMEWPLPSLTAENIIFLARADEDSEVVLHRGDGPAEVFEGDDVVRIDLPGLEDLKIRPAQDITIKVDGEPYQPPRRRMTPNQIIEAATDSTPGQVYLLRIKRGGENVSYKDQGDTPIRLRNGMEFSTVSLGPTPVSDPAFEKGPALFLKGLAALGYKPQFAGETKDSIFFDYVVETGCLAGKAVRMGIVVPADFPLTWPSGPHVSPRIHVNQPSGEHPKGGVHESASFESTAGGLWQYWSRPYAHHGGVSEPVQAYMAHLWKLWDSQ